MAIGSSIYKASINLANLNTHYYEDLNLTLAMHPSETETRLMFRLAAFLYSAHDKLEFTKGLSDADLPDIWQKNYSGDIEHWIDLGQPDEKRIRQACGKASEVSIFTYQPGKALPWFEKIKNKLTRSNNLKVYHMEETENGPLEKIAERAMKLTCVIEDEHIYIGNDVERVRIDIRLAHP